MRRIVLTVAALLAAACGGDSTGPAPTPTPTQIRLLTGHTAPVTLLAFSPDGKTLASTGTVNLPPQRDGSVRVWDVTAGTQLATVATAGTNALTFSPDGTLLAGASGGDPV